MRPPTRSALLAVLLVSSTATRAAGQAPAVSPPAAAPATPAAPTTWRVGGAPRGAYVLADTQPAAAVLTRAGAALTLRRLPDPPAAPGEFGTAGWSLPAAVYRGARARVSAEVRPRGVGGGASLWVRVDGANGAVLGLDNAEGRRVAGTGDWQRQAVTLEVPTEATRVVFGALLLGGGEVAVRGLRVERVERPLADAPVHPDARQVFDSALALAKRHALWRDTVTWPAAEADLRRQIAGAARREDAYPVVAALTHRLGDRHSHFRPPDGAPTGLVPARPPVRSGEASPARASAAPTARAPEPPAAPRWFAAERVGYLRVPAHGGFDAAASRAYATAARAALAGQHARGACGYVVDLRGNGGGNMWPMLAGLRPLLGTDTLGAFRAGAGPGAPTRWWTARAPWDAADAYARGTPPWPDLAAAPVAVLTDSATASSGEAVAIAFRGRPRARSFGGPTYGVSTSNSMYPLPGGGLLLLTTGIELDRRGRAYGAEVVPDERVPEAPGRDAPLAAALAWLAAQPACGTRGG